MPLLVRQVIKERYGNQILLRQVKLLLKILTLPIITIYCCCCLLLFFFFFFFFFKGTLVHKEIQISDFISWDVLSKLLYQESSNLTICNLICSSIHDYHFLWFNIAFYILFLVDSFLVNQLNFSSSFFQREGDFYFYFLIIKEGGFLFIQWLLILD